MTSYEEPQNKPLKDFFKVLSLSLAKDGLPYISTMEARKVGRGLTSICQQAAVKLPPGVHVLLDCSVCEY